MSDHLVLAAPAKLNLFLHVVGRRADGYHLIESVFALIDLADTVRLAPRDDGAIVRARPLAYVAEADDLSIRAAKVLQQATGCAAGVTIEVDKRIPMGGGLGGGSSDAATVLLGLNRLWRLHLSRDDLARIGLALGADVPFFVRGDHAFVQGIGERLTPVSLPMCWFALAIPAATVDTGSIFGAAELTRSTPSAKINVFSESYGRNDLAPVAVARFPVVGQALALLARESAAARMSGSGACVFAPFASERAARAAVEKLPAGIAGRVVRTLARHPQHAFA